MPTLCCILCFFSTASSFNGFKTSAADNKGSQYRTPRRTYLDIVRAHIEVSLVKRHIKENRKKVHEFHWHIYSTALTLSGKVGITEDMPRIIRGKQHHRANPDSRTPSDFYRPTITVLLLDRLVFTVNLMKFCMRSQEVLSVSNSSWLSCQVRFMIKNSS